jgi:hypothetical protein
LRPLPLRKWSNIFEPRRGNSRTVRAALPELYDDFAAIEVEPTVKMAGGASEPLRYERQHVEVLARAVGQLFEIPANSELATPEAMPRKPRDLISQGRSRDWRDGQASIERDVGIQTLELAQEPNLGRTVLQKLQDESDECTS